MRRWLRLYPRWWRQRYGDEFEDVIAALADDRRSWWLAVDIARGALDAHVRGRLELKRHATDCALRRGILDGGLIALALAVLVVVTNVVLPPGPRQSDGDPRSLVLSLAVGASVALALTLIGARCRRGSDTMLAGVKGGAAAGCVIAVVVTLSFLTVNNLFLDIVSQQHDKHVAFDSSGWSSMRAYLSVRQLRSALVLVPIGTLAGALLGFIGGSVIPRPARPR